MKRKNCKQSKDSNPNWGKKIKLESPDRNITNNIYVVGSYGVRSPSFKSIRFMDSIITSGNKTLSYSSEVIN